MRFYTINRLLRQLLSSYVPALIYCNSLYSQNKDIIPPSPQTAAFVKYINYNVSPYNGLPEISIPLYNIELKDISIPISLSYHASGIRYGQANGEVGVGWSLNPGYRVSRTVYGRPDELFTKPSNASIWDSLYTYQNDYQLDNFISQFLYRYDNNIPRPYNHAMVDGEFDIFNFSLPSESGSFIISDRTNKIIKSIEGSNVKFSYSIGQIGIHNSISKFELTDDNGIEYHLGIGADVSASIYEASNSEYQGMLPTAWALREIVSPYNEKVTFSYNVEGVSQWRSDLRSVSITEGLRCYADVPGSHTMGDVGTDISYSTFFTNEIKSDKETVKFFRNSGTNEVERIEIYTASNSLIKSIRFFYSFNGIHSFLDSVKIQDKSNVPVEIYKFDYYARSTSGSSLAKDEWGYYMPGSPINCFHDQFRSDPIFYYETSEQTIPSPTYLTTVGFLMNNTLFRDNISTAPDFFSLKKITYPTGGSTEYVYESNKYTDMYNNSKWGGGLRIKEIRNTDHINQTTLLRKYTYGISQSGLGKAQIYMNYRLFANETIYFTSASIQFPDEEHAVPIRTLTYSTTMNGDVDIDGFVGSAVIYPEVNEDIEAVGGQRGGRIKYKYDISSERYGAMTLNKGISSGGGCPITIWNGYHPSYVHRYSTWRKPLLIEKTYYEYKANSYNKVKTENYSYSSNQLFTDSGFKVKPFASSPGYSPLVTNYYSHINSFFDYGFYSIEGGRTLLYEKKETIYSPEDSIVNTTQYSHTSFGHVSTETKFGSNDKTITQYTYPYDLTNINSSTPLNQSIILLNNLNKLSTAIETRVYKIKNGETQQKLAEASFIQYKQNAPFPERVFKTESSSLIDNFSPVTVTSGVVSKDPSYNPIENIDAYDTAGNVLEMHKENDIYNSYIWDYNKKLPIAKVINARYSQIAYTSFESDGKGNWNFSNTGQNDGTAPTGSKIYSLTAPINSGSLALGNYVVSYWSKGGNVLVNGTAGTLIFTVGSWSLYKHTLNNITAAQVAGSGFIDELRLYPQGAQMNTYTYIPLIGMECVTNSADQTTYYEYDSFNRLRHIRDNERRIIKTFEYTYMSQP